MRFRHGFRLKIMVLTTLLCGLVLGSFGFVVWDHIHRSGQKRLDREIENIANHHLDFLVSRGHHPPSPFPASFFGEEFRDLSLWVRHDDGRTLHRTHAWPEALVAEDLPVVGPTGERGPPPRPREMHRRPRHRRPIVARTVHRGGGSWRLGAVRDGPVSLTVCLDLRRYREMLHRTRAVFLLALPLALLVAATGGWWLAHRALRPVAAVTRAAEQISASELSRRIPEMGADAEFHRLVQVFNRMLARLERSFEQAARFTVDASHELRTPLTIMQGELEAALRDVPGDSEAERALTTQLEEVHRLKSLVRRLLLLTRADRGALLTRQEPVDLTALVRGSLEDAAVLGPKLAIEGRVEPDVAVEGDEDLLRQAVQNLVSNAVKHNVAQGSVEILLETDGERASIVVTNTGPAIDDEDRERIFDRFYRCDPSRTRGVDGAGLGLSLAREIARAHGGDLVYEGRRDGRNRFALRLPRA
jgi:two-component system heavy metal sensor histidine kinase CusS